MPIPRLEKIYSAGAKGGQVRLIQEWLCLHGFGTGIDGDFGPATRAAVLSFQKKKQLPQTGVVNARTYEELVAPMRAAIEPIDPGHRSLGQLVVAYARQHLKQHPREVGGDNRGPWVRLYMDGKDGPSQYWCAGFASYILSRACESMDNALPLTTSVSCDALANSAKTNDLFVSENDVRQGSVIRPGAFFLVRKSASDWTHTGIVTRIEPNVFRTIEGNTNDDGNRNGYEVCERTRGSKKKDFIAI